MVDPPKAPACRDYYVDLDISIHASRAELKKKFRELALQHHPDKTAPGEIVDAAIFRQVALLRRFEVRNVVYKGQKLTTP